MFLDLGPAARVAACAASLALLAARSPAQEQVGPARCTSCHAGLAKTSWERSHRGSAKQLDEPKAAVFAAATSGNAKAARCVACHAPTTAGAEKGVGCESCHGPGSQYRVPHQQAAFYAKPEAERMGMADLRGQPERIARLCVDCHVLDPGRDAALAAAGHPTGAGYALLGRKLDEMKHWPSNDDDAPLSRRRTYDAAFLARVTAAASAPVAARLAGLAKGGALAAKAAPRGVVEAPAAGALPAVDPFFADEVPEYVPGTLDTKPRAARVVRSLAPEPMPVEIAPPPLAPPAAPSPSPEAPNVSTPQATLAARLPPADAAELRGRAIRVLQQLLREGRAAERMPQPAPPAAFTGADGELLRLQDEAMVLALESLRKDE